LRCLKLRLWSRSCRQSINYLNMAHRHSRNRRWQQIRACNTNFFGGKAE
jgi:hypothetical protein